jgi:hypothetical protein
MSDLYKRLLENNRIQLENKQQWERNFLWLRDKINSICMLDSRWKVQMHDNMKGFDLFFTQPWKSPVVLTVFLVSSGILIDKGWQDENNQTQISEETRKDFLIDEVEAIILEFINLHNIILPEME